MAHLARCLVLPLLLGVATTFAVAWWGALRPAGRIVVGSQTYDNGGDLTVFFIRSNAMGVSRACLVLGKTERFISSTQSTLGKGHYHDASLWGRLDPGVVPKLSDTSAQVIQNGALLLQESAGGWPMLALWTSRESIDEAYATTRSTPLAATGRAEVGGRVFPYRPLWPGFAVNTAIFAALWFVVLGPTLSAQHDPAADRAPTAASALPADTNSKTPPAICAPNADNPHRAARRLSNHAASSSCVSAGDI